MAVLTEKRLKFCREYLKNPNIQGATAAYLKVYSKKNSPETAKRAALRLLRDEKIVEFLRDVRQCVVKKMGLTLEEHLKNLEELRDEARANRQFSAAVSAESQRGKAAGLYTEKREIEGELTIVWGGDDNKDTVQSEIPAERNS